MKAYPKKINLTAKKKTFFSQAFDFLGKSGLSVKKENRKRTFKQKKYLHSFTRYHKGHRTKTSIMALKKKVYSKRTKAT